MESPILSYGRHSATGISLSYDVSDEVFVSVLVTCSGVRMSVSVVGLEDRWFTVDPLAELEFCSRFIELGITDDACHFVHFMDDAVSCLFFDTDRKTLTDTLSKISSRTKIHVGPAIGTMSRDVYIMIVDYVDGLRGLVPARRHS